jgi:ABC-2 type transport system ATP-binding protein
MAVIQAAGLTKEFRLGFRRTKALAVDQLDLEVQEGEIFGFLGPNGAGKTTTLKMLMGFIRPTSGKAWLFGEEIGEVRVRQQIGFLPESPYFYDYLTATEFLAFYGRLFGLRRDVINERTALLLKQVGLESSGRLQLRKFSKGMLQRIGIAQALINDPQLVILDEPMSGLDPIGRKEVRDLILQLKERGKTVFFSSHIIPDVEMLCDRVGILVRGRLHDIGRLSEILETRVKYIEIVAARIDHDAARRVDYLAGKTTATGNNLLIRVPQEEEVEQALAIVKELKGKLISVLPVKETLEEHFIREAQKER